MLIANKLFSYLYALYTYMQRKVKGFGYQNPILENLSCLWVSVIWGKLGDHMGHVPSSPNSVPLLWTRSSGDIVA